MAVADLKLIAAVLVVVGAVLNLLLLIYSPSALLLEQSKTQPPWLKWVAWAVTSLAAVAYIVLDYLQGW